MYVLYHGEPNRYTERAINRVLHPYGAVRMEGSFAQDIVELYYTVPEWVNLDQVEHELMSQVDGLEVHI